MTTDLGKPIAYGRTAEIYAWNQDQVLKLFYDWYGLDAIEYEAHIARSSVCQRTARAGGGGYSTRERPQWPGVTSA